MRQKIKFALLYPLSLILLSCTHKVQPFSETLEQQVHDNLDFSKFDLNRQDSHLDLLVSSASGRRFFTRDNIAEYISHATASGEKYQLSRFNVLSETESVNSRFASIVYEATWKVSLGNAPPRKLQVVSHEIWERQIDGWRRLAAAVDSDASPGPQTVVPQTVTASRDQTGQHPGVLAVRTHSAIFCANAVSDTPNPQSPAVCSINAPGFYGDVKPSYSVSSSGVGTVTLTCGGQGNHVTCVARVQ